MFQGRDQKHMLTITQRLERIVLIWKVVTFVADYDLCVELIAIALSVIPFVYSSKIYFRKPFIESTY